MIIEIGILAAAAALGGLLAARSLRTKPSAPALPAAEPEEEPEDPFAGFIAGIGDVVACGEETRWPQRAIVLSVDGQPMTAVLLSEEDGAKQATVVFAPPDRHVYWLEQHDIDLPPTPPTRMEIDGYLLDRDRLLSVGLTVHGDGLTEIGTGGRFALYRGTVGDAAVVLQGATSYVWYGRRLSPDDYDCLGRGERD